MHYILWSGYPAGHARLWTCDLCRLTGLRELGNSVPTDFDELITISDHIVELLLVLVSCHVVSSNPRLCWLFIPYSREKDLVANAISTYMRQPIAD